MADQPVFITGRAAVLVGQYTKFSLSDPAGTPAHEFVFAAEEVVTPDGKLRGSWGKDYRHVGYADIRVEIMPTKKMLKSAVTALKAEKVAVLANAQREATRLEGEIQKLLAIEFDGEVRHA